jgi:hypothetical protein
MKCPFCQYENEEGVLYCDQCKSDLGVAPVPPAVAMAIPVDISQETQGVDIPLARPVAEVASTQKSSYLPSGATPEVPPLEQTAVRESTDVAPVPAGSDRLPPGAEPKLVVLRGLRINVEYPVYEGRNYIGRTDEQPVDIDLEDQEAPDRIFSSRQHACISYENGELVIEDLKSSNGTFVNRTRVHPGQRRPLKANDIVQIGTVQMKVKVYWIAE